MMHKVGLILIAAFLFLSGGVLWWTSTTDSPIQVALRHVRPVETLNVRLKWLHQAQFAGNYVAEKKGFYKKRGLIVNLERGGFDFPPIDGVLSGKVDIAVADAAELLGKLSENKNAHIKAIATISQKSPAIFFSLKESNIISPHDFIGKSIGVRPRSGTWYPYLAIMENAGVDRKKVKEVPVGFDLTPLYRGEVDVIPAFRINEPRLATASGHEINLIKPEDYGVDTYGDVLIASEETLQNRPAVVKAFVEATLEGWEYALAHQDEALDIVLQYATDSTREHQKYMLAESAPLLKPFPETAIGQMDEAGWQRTYEILNKYNLLAEEFDVRTAYTDQFLPGAKK